jgi:Holliday junction resolvase-like predicted endonuclease
MIYGLDVKTIIKLLLDYAPATILEEMALTESTRDIWESELKSEQGTFSGDYSIVDFSTLALYYVTANRRAFNRKPSLEQLLAYGRVEIDLLTLHRFAEMVKAEEFDKVEKLVKAVPKEKRQKILAEARQHRTHKHDWDAVANMRAELLNSGKEPKDADSILRAKLKIHPSTYSDWRKRDSQKRKPTV